MHFTIQEKEKLLIYLSGEVAKKRLKKGIKLNYPESVSLISNYIMDYARSGENIYNILKYSKNILTYDQVMDGVPELIEKIQIEATFPDGTKLVTIHNPIKGKSKIIPGEYKLKKNNIYFFSERKKIFRKIFNSGDRVIQIGSHFNFYKVNKFLKFNRKGTKGYKLNIPSGTCIRIYPKKNKIVELVEIGGEKKIYGY